MSKLSKSLKELIALPAVRPGLVPAPPDIRQLLTTIANDAARNGIGRPSWLTLSGQELVSAELIREVGLKCISFNGIPRTINCLNQFRDGLPHSVQSQLSNRPTRQPTSENINSIQSRGQALWKSIYHPLDNKLVGRLSQAHPDLPVIIINSHYGSLLSDPIERHGLASVGRVLTSLVGIACLRAQSGTGPQVLSHIYGLRKAFEDSSFEQEPKENLQGAELLTTDAGGEWILSTVDSIVNAIGQGISTFAVHKPKL